MNKCPRCKQMRAQEQFYRIVSRKSYDPDFADENNLRYFKKPTKLCSDCRKILREKARKQKNTKENTH